MPAPPSKWFEMYPDTKDSSEDALLYIFPEHLISGTSKDPNKFTCDDDGKRSMGCTLEESGARPRTINDSDCWWPQFVDSGRHFKFGHTEVTQGYFKGIILPEGTALRFVVPGDGKRLVAWNDQEYIKSLLKMVRAHPPLIIRLRAPKIGRASLNGRSSEEQERIRTWKRNSAERRKGSEPRGYSTERTRGIRNGNIQRGLSPFEPKGDRLDPID